MKTYKIIAILCISLYAAVTFSACGTDVVDADYPRQKIYLPASVNSQIYTIDKAKISTGSTPTPGAPYQFLIDEEAETFTVPLSVYRSGVNNKGSVKVRIIFDNDLVYDHILSGDLDPSIEALLLCDYPETIKIQDGDASALVNVICDLCYIRDAAKKGKKLAFGISIASDDRDVQEGKGSVVFVIDTALFDYL